MDKKTSHAILLLLDLFCLWALWIFYKEFQRISMEIFNQVDMISFSNRIGFTIVAVGFLPIHIFTVVDNARPNLFKKYIPIVNKSVIVLVAGLLAAGFISTSWLKSQVENAGYVYCRNASGVSALAKSLVYTKDMKICEDLVKSKKEG